MRKLVWFTLGFGAACVLGAYVLPRTTLFWLMLCISTGAIWAAVLGRKRVPYRAAALVLVGCTVGFSWFSQYYRLILKPAAALDGQTQSASIRVSDYSYETAYGTGADGSISIDGKRYQIRVYLKEKQALEPGDILEGQFRFRVTTPDGAEEATYHPGKGIFLLAYQKEEISVSQSSATWRDYPAWLRRQIQTVLRTCFPEDTHPFAKALLLGDTADLDYETDTDLKISGIRHVAAVSGLHVSILFSLIGMVTMRKRFLTALLGMPILCLFSALAGFTPSVTRACVMAGLMLLAALFDREYDGPTALAFSAMVMLMINPLVITSVSFQLSVCSVAGIYLFSPGIRKWLAAFLGETKGRRSKGLLARWASGSVSLTLGAGILTIPLCAWYFGTVSLIGVVTNLLTLWVISFVFYGILAVCLVFLISQPGAMLLAKLISVPIRYVLLTAKILADFPLASVYTRSPYITAWLVFCYGLLFLFSASGNRKPKVLACCAALGLCFSLLASWAEPLLDDTRLMVLDVGQGQCLLLQSGGKTYMIDCGGDSDVTAADIAAETLLSQGITRLDGLILTHGDRDHAGAVGPLLSRVDTDLLLLPPVRTELAEKTGGEVVYAAQDLVLTDEEISIRIFAPIYSGDSNENSLCILFDTENCDILVTGDRSGFGERMLLRHADIPQVDVLIAGHHGSANSTCEELLAAVRPETVCISAGADNPYGHPAPQLLERLQAFGCTVFRTDQNGTIVIRR